MAVLFSSEMNGLLNTTPVSLPSGGIVDGNVRVKRATITLAAQTTSDTIVIAKAYEGESFLYGVITLVQLLAVAPRLPSALPEPLENIEQRLVILP